MRAGFTDTLSTYNLLITVTSGSNIKSIIFELISWAFVAKLL